MWFILPVFDLKYYCFKQYQHNDASEKSNEKRKKKALDKIDYGFR